eukprot:1142087-Pelagomonas_calceolata.AAC.7
MMQESVQFTTYAPTLAGASPGASTAMEDKKDPGGISASTCCCRSDKEPCQSYMQKAASGSTELAACKQKYHNTQQHVLEYEHRAHPQEACF